jgi:hypothetical protein
VSQEQTITVTVTAKRTGFLGNPASIFIKYRLYEMMQPFNRRTNYSDVKGTVVITEEVVTEKKTILARAPFNPLAQRLPLVSETELKSPEVQNLTFTIMATRTPSTTENIRSRLTEILYYLNSKANYSDVEGEISVTEQVVTSKQTTVTRPSQSNDVGKTESKSVKIDPTLGLNDDCPF